eukprot:m.330317 g.330317  ORF g.330317 m.330317 type:complete len:167 (+) comp16581_c0_seq2:531-1031(+)
MAPQIDYFQHIFLPVAKRFGIDAVCDIQRRGYFPRGGGVVQVTVQPVEELTPITMTQMGNITDVNIRSFIAGRLPIRIANETAAAACQTLEQYFGENVPNIRKEIVHEQAAIGTGSGILIVATTSTGCILGGSALGKKGLPAAKVGKVVFIRTYMWFTLRLLGRCR